MFFGIRHVHGTTLALRHAGGFAKQFCHDRISGDAAVEGNPMVAIRSDHAIPFFTGRDQTRGDGLLPDIQVHKTADLSGLIQFSAALFHAAY
jgi:hypothetical protein